MSKMYNVTREVAAKQLGISTRTIDRYVKSWKLSYKKVANKVILAKDEIEWLKEDFAMLRQEMDSERVHETAIQPQDSTGHAYSSSISRASRLALEEAIDEKVDKFFLIFKEKEKILEEKNKIIFMLQQRISELETKLQNMVALPDYTKEKQSMLIEKEKLEQKVIELKSGFKTEKMKTTFFGWFALVCVIFVIIMIFVTK